VQSYHITVEWCLKTIRGKILSMLSQF
jgi:hypothetical protein